MCGICATIEMNRDVIPGHRQALSLLDDRVRVLVTQQNEGDFCHIRNDYPGVSRIVCIISVNKD